MVRMRARDASPDAWNQTLRAPHVGAIRLAQLVSEHSLLVSEAKAEADQRRRQAERDREPGAKRNSQSERRHQQPRIAWMADEPVGAAVDDLMVGLDDDGELEEATQFAHGPRPQSKSGCEHGQPERHGPPTRPWQREIAAPPSSQHSEADSREHRQRKRDEASITVLGVASPRAKRQRDLEDPPGPSAQPE